MIRLIARCAQLKAIDGARIAISTRRIVPVVLVVVALGLPGSALKAQNQSLAQAASQLSWSPRNLAALRALFRDSNSVKEFLHQIDGSASGMLLNVIDGVKEYQLVDLAHDGWFELVALVDISGRGLYNNIMIVDSSPTGFVVREIHGFDIEDLDSVLIDLDGNGEMEIVVPQALEPDRGRATRTATMVEIYSWNRRGVEKVSGRFRSYYRDVVLPKLEHRLKESEQSPDAGITASERERRRQLQATYRTEIDAVKVRLAAK